MTPPAGQPGRAPWLFTGVPASGTTGSSLRAMHLPRALIERTAGQVVAAYGRRGIPSLALSIALRSRLWRRPLHVASSRLWPVPALTMLRGGVGGQLLDLHDHPRLQMEALGIGLGVQRRRQLDDLVERNIEAFERLAVPSASFARLCALPEERVIIATNGSDTDRITPQPWRDEPVIALVSGAAPGRGIELLVEAAARLHARDPGVRLRLALSPTGPGSARYLAQLRGALAGRDWASIEEVPYQRLAAFLGGAWVLVIPHPPGPYHDVATPVKLFDGMAAGRPTVVTPRLEMASIVRSADAGLVADDGADALEAAIARLLDDEGERRRLAGNARRAAERDFDWRAISSAVADAVLGTPVLPPDAPIP
jgi:glycosyltransferase involved in cell wall biosynthesis